MKRTLPKLLLALLIVSTFIDPVQGAQKKNKSRKTTKEAVFTAQPPTTIPVVPRLQPGMKRQGAGDTVSSEALVGSGTTRPTELQMRRGASTTTDLRFLPKIAPKRKEKPERHAPPNNPQEIPGVFPGIGTESKPLYEALAPMPAPLTSFLGLDFLNWGSGRPPDTVGDVGPTHYIQSVNSSVGIYRKSDNVQLAAFTYDTFMSQGSFGNLCDTDNFGDPVILYDTFEDRWVLTDFAFQLDGLGNVINPPGAFQCFAVSKTGDPVSGGWNFYSLHMTDALNDYPKLGIWPDGIYMSANMFGFPATGSFQGTRVWALNKAQMYAGDPTIQVVQFSPPVAEFSLLPSNARLQTGTPPAGSPNYFATVFNFINAITTYKFHVDWNAISASTFTGPFITIAPASWANSPATVPSQGGQPNDTLAPRLMMQNQYVNIGGVESLWNTHTVRHPTTAGVAAVRYYEHTVTGGTVAANTTQAATHAPDTINRYMPSAAVDRAGNMAIGYSASSAALFPAIRYAGRLATDPLNTLPQTETSLVEGTGSQSSSNRWGDYSAMSLDPDGCTFWFTNEYYITTGTNWQTRVGSFAYPSCTPVTSGTVEGTVTAVVGGAPINGATVHLGSRTATTNASGFYQFLNIPSGTYPNITVTAPGYDPGSTDIIVVTDAATTVKDFALTAAAVSTCPTDTTQADFQTGVPTAVDLTTIPGDVILTEPANLNQQNETVGNSGVGVTVTTWGGQTFTPSVTGTMRRVDLNMFCSGCTGTIPNLTLSLRATASGIPTGADLATATLPGFSSGAALFYTVNFGTPPLLTAGTQYALVIRPTANPAPGTYALTRSGTSTVGADVYAGGTRVAGATSGTVWSVPLTGGISTDAGFRIYISTGFSPSGNLVSSVRDSNPAPGFTSTWSTLTYNATVPADTSLSFQLAGSNSPLGPFTFVGPDGTAGTFFTTSGSSISQFIGERYLKYKAYLSTTNGAVTPALHDVTLCFQNVDCATIAAPITPTPAQVCANSTGNTATGPAGMTTYQWGIANGTITGGANAQSVTYDAGASGNVDLSLTVTFGTCEVQNTINVPIVVTLTPTITPGGPTTFCTGGSVTLTSNSASGNQWYLDGNPIGGETNQAYVATASGSYTVVVTTSGCASAPSAATVVTVNPTPPTPTITPGGPTTFCTGGSVTLTSSSASGNQWYLDGNPIGGETNQAYVATASGSYTVVVTASGCPSAPSAATVVTVTATNPAPTITPGGPTTFCAGGSVTLTSSSATGNQWHLDGNLIGGETNQAYVATASGSYTVVNTNGCPSAPSPPVVVTVNPAPPQPTVTPGGPTTFCTSGSVTLTSSSATGNQWYLNGNPIGGETNQAYVATASGSYTVAVTASGCSSAPSAATVVTVNPTPPTPTITPGGPTTFCTGGSVLLTSSSATGNQWYLNGNPIGGETNQTYTVSAAGDYTVVVTSGACSSNASAATSVTVSPLPNATITSPSPIVSGASSSASVANAGVGATYAWTIGNGSFVGPTNGDTVNFTAGSAGTLTLGVMVTTGAGCPDSDSLNVTVTSVAPSVSVTSVSPNNGPYLGGTAVTITGTGFLAGASVTFDASTATSVVVVNSTTITANTPAHAAGAVNVTVTNTDTTSGTLTNGYTYNPQRFDANGDGSIDPSDIFYLVNYLFSGGPAPAGPFGLMSGDANGDNVVDPADIFYIVNYLFLGGPQPAATTGRIAVEGEGRLSGSVILGTAVVRDGRTFVPVTVTTASGSITPQALSLNLRVTGDGSIIAIRRAGAAKSTQPVLEMTRATTNGAAYLVAFPDNVLGSSTVIAEIELARGEDLVRIDIDPKLTLLSSGGVHQATVSAGNLEVRGATVGTRRPSARERN